MAKKLISYDDQKPGLGLPDPVTARMDNSYGRIPVAVSPSPALGGLGTLRTMLALAPTRPCAVVFLGSSTTESAYSDVDNKYPSIVTAALQRAYPTGTPSAMTNMPKWTVAATHNPDPGVHGYNGGRGGTRSNTYLTEVDLDNLGIIQPSIIIHAVGANDWFDHTPPEDYKARMLTALDSIDNVVDGPLVHVLVHQHSRNVPASQYTWDQYGAILHEIATERAASCVFVDASETFYALGIPGPDPLGLGHSDKVHLVDRGNWALAEQVTQAIANIGARAPLPIVIPGEPGEPGEPVTATLASTSTANPGSGPLTRTFADMDLGTPAPDRTIIVAVMAWAGAEGGNLASVEINGVPATVDYSAPIELNQPIMGFARLAIPEGETATIDVSVDGPPSSVARWGIAVVAVTGGPIAFGIPAANPTTVTVDGASGGFVLASAYRPGGSEIWKGDVELLWSQEMESPRRLIGGISTASGPVTATIDGEQYSRVAAIPYRRAD